MLDCDLENLPLELVHSIQKVYLPAGLNLTQKAFREAEGGEYEACSFSLNGHNIAFRVAKITPTKLGQFVTIWKRSTPQDKIVPLDIDDGVDFVIVSVSNGIYHGQFIFDQKILLEKRIMSQNTQEGKRAFRIYPPWTQPISSTALATQKWQLPYFLYLEPTLDNNREEVRRLFKQKN